MLSSIMWYHSDKSVSMSMWTYKGFKQQDKRVKSVIFAVFSLASAKLSRGRGTTAPIILCAPLTYTELVGQMKKQRTLVASFKPEVGKHFGFPVPGNESGEKVALKQKTLQLS